jgi:hypothetical protein
MRSYRYAGGATQSYRDAKSLLDAVYSSGRLVFPFDLALRLLGGCVLAVSSVGDLFTALAQANFERILGTAESLWVDFKREPYAVDGSTGRLTPKGKWELAKDVGAFANRGPGLIVLGYETTRHENDTVETAAAHRPIRKSIVDINAYREVISNWLFPSIRGVEFHWFPPDREVDLGVLIIEVVDQDETQRYFLLRRVVDEAGRLRESGAFAVPLREGDRTEFVSAEMLHPLLVPSTTGSASRAGVGGEGWRTAEAATQGTDARGDQRVLDLEERLGWSDQPLYLLQALPPPRAPEVLTGFYEREGLWMALNHPESLRPMGFNLETGGAPAAVENGWFVSRPSHHALWLDADGFFTAAGVADQEFLGWALNDGRSPDQPLKINSLTLVEFTLEFFRFVQRELMARTQVARWLVRVICLRFARYRVGLYEGTTSKSLAARRAPHPATSDEWIREFAPIGEPGRDAFAALERVYALFNLPSSAIPFTEDASVSEAAIRSVR